MSVRWNTLLINQISSCQPIFHYNPNVLTGISSTLAQITLMKCYVTYDIYSTVIKMFIKLSIAAFPITWLFSRRG